jgi:hypothetical protein
MTCPVFLDKIQLTFFINTKIVNIDKKKDKMIHLFTNKLLVFVCIIIK